MLTFDHVDYESFTEMYQAVLKYLIETPQYKIAPRGLPINEVVNAAVIFDPKACSIDFKRTGAPDRQEVYDKYKAEELAWYLSGNTLATSAPSKFWHKLADDSGNITSNYGHMMLFDKKYPPYQNATKMGFSGMKHQTAIDKVVETLRNDRDSRQAVVHYNEPKYCYPQNKDFPCTMNSQFFIRNGTLSMTTTMRSCDVILGFTYDVCWNAHFMGMVRDELQKNGMKLELGELTMIFGSLHLYSKNMDLAEKITGGPKSA